MGKSLLQKYPPSKPCSCKICIGYCSRPGWWTPVEADKAINEGYASRMMLEISPDNLFGILSPAFRGNEMKFSYEIFKDNGCTFLNENLCELYGSGLQPLECRFCHHSRKGLGIKCHEDIGREWNSDTGRDIIVKWAKLTGFLGKDIMH